MYSIELVGEEKHSFLKYISLDKNNIIDNNNFIFIEDEMPQTYKLLASFGEFYYNYLNTHKIKITYREEGKPQAAFSGSIKYFNRLIIEYENLDIMNEMLNIVVKFNDDSFLNNKMPIYISKKGGYWEKYDNIFVQPLDNIFIDQNIKNTLINNLDNFFALKDKYNNFGKLHKYNILLHGIHGSGKTSLAKALALKYKYSLYSINISKSLNNDNLIDLMSSIKDKSIILYEDIDTCFNDRVSMNSEITYSCITNILDGTFTKGNSIISILTANNISFLDKPFLRQGRIDQIITFDYPKKEQIEKAYKSLIDKEDDNFDEFYHKIKSEKITMSGVIDFLFKYPKNHISKIGELIKDNNLISEEKDIYI